jgi:hypothetical protein
MIGGKKGNSLRWRATLLLPLLALVLGAGCVTQMATSEQAAREEIKRNFSAWRLLTADDLERDDFSKWSADHPGIAPGFNKGDYFGDGRNAYSALITTTDDRGKVVRLVVMGQEPSGRFVTYSVFSESPVERMPAIFTSKAGEYHAYLDDQLIPVPVEGVVYTHPGISQKLFFWNKDRFVDIELE